MRRNNYEEELWQHDSQIVLRSNYFRKFIPLLFVGAYLEQKEGQNIVTEWCEHKIKATFELGTLENLTVYGLLVWPPFGLIYEFLVFSLILIFLIYFPYLGDIS